ncbi:MAG: aspartate dehydrogenase [Methanobacteriota archaeon]
MRVALIGCGAIGSIIAKAIADGAVSAELQLLYDADRKAAERVLGIFKKKPRIAEGIEKILNSNADVVVEAASQEAVKSFAARILGSKKSIMIMSAGALADEKFFDKIKKIAGKNKVKIYLPSGAIGGLDALKSASAARIYEVTLTTTKPPNALKGAEKIREKAVLYEGSAREAIKKFPANVNVAVALSLAGIGVKKTKVRVVADPGSDKNIHEVFARGDFGEFKFRVENVPSPQNPRTSYLAALSAIATLKKITSHVEIGT